MAPTPNVESKRVAVVLVEGVGDDAPGQTSTTVAATLVGALGRDVAEGSGEIPVVVPGPPGARREVYRAPTRTLTRSIGRATHRIDLVEMRWSDLSRFPSGLVWFFVALFGFALQIATVGMEAVHRPAAGAGEARPARSWAWPVVAALALGVACAVAAGARWDAPAGVLAAGLAAGAVLLAAVLRREPDSLAAANRLQNAASWWLAAVVIPGTVATATAGVAFWLAIEGTPGPGGLGVAIAFLGGLAAAAALGKGLAEGGWRYGGRGWQRLLDPRWWSVGLLALTALLTVRRWADTGSVTAGTARALLEVAGFGLRGAWLVMASLTIVTLVLLLASIPTQRDAWFTSVATTVLSPLLVATFGVLLIGGIGTVAFATAEDETWGTDLRHVRCLESPASWTTGERCAGDASPREDWLPVRDGIVATAERAALLDDVVVPLRRRGAVLSPGKDDAAARRDAAEAERLDDLAAAAERDAEATPVDWAKDLYRTTTLPLGWILIATASLGIAAAIAYFAGRAASPADRLTRGLGRLTGRTAGGVLVAGGLLAAAWMWVVWTGDDVRWPVPGVASVTGAGVGSAVVLGVLAALRFLPVHPGRLMASVGGGLEALRRFIDRGFDVATYLRIDRGGDGVRTRVVVRFRALLDELAEDHDVIVIAAHSQGSMYAVATLMGDAYRREPEPGSLWGVRPLSEIEGSEPVAGALSGLLTFGCPIRQTYAARLPGKYAWTGSPASVAARLQPLGLSWVNVYRARDFIGRGVFHDPAAGPGAPGEGRRVPLPGAATGVEAMDVWLRGSGHHTGYWGDAELALWLDRMLRRATGEPDPAPPAGYIVT